jgi:hypothetical protein
MRRFKMVPLSPYCREFGAVSSNIWCTSIYEGALKAGRNRVHGYLSLRTLTGKSGQMICTNNVADPETYS